MRYIGGSVTCQSERFPAILFCQAILIAVLTAFSQTTTLRQDLLLDTNWKFIKSDVTGAEGISFSDAAWTTISLPHTWNNIDGQDGGSNYYRGIGWYRKHFTVASAEAGRGIFLKFDGANIVTDVYLNGTALGTHKGGFGAFCFDVTSLVNIGADNVLAVKVNNAYNADIPPLSADFTFFGGIYRDVHLISTDKLAITPLDYASPGVYVKTTNVSAASATVTVTAKVRNNNTTSKSVTMNAVIEDGFGTGVSSLTVTQTIAANSSYDFTQSKTISNPHLWNGRTDPYIYKVIVTVLDGSTVTDSLEQPLGFRYFRVSPDSGFFLNGSSLDLHGVNRHQDRINMGWAIGKAEHLEDFNLIKEMGCTAIRLAHYQHAQYFYSLCDTGGLVIWAEIPVVNNVTISDSFYANAKQQLRELIRQNYNHPSICFWGIGNEIAGSPNPNVLESQLSDSVAKEDPTRISTYASNAGDADSLNTHTGVVGYNKYFGWYNGTYNDFAPWADNIHATYPARKNGVSEYGAGSSIIQHQNNPTSVTASSLWHPEEYQTTFHEVHWKAMKTRNFLWGKFIWNMFDFAVDSRNEGDTPGRNDKGMVTYDRKTRKDVFYWYKANWSTTPFAYITSRRFTPRTDSIVYVKVYSNMDTVQLFVNGVSLGKKISSDRIFRWDTVGLQEGDNLIKAVGLKQGTQYPDSCIWTRIVVPVPISQGKTATASSVQAGNEAPNGNDGDMQGTRWTAADATYPQWWMVDLGSVCRLDSVVITWYGTGRLYKFIVEASNSPLSGFTTIVDRSNNIESGTTRNTVNATGRYVRITVSGESTAGGWASFYEAKIWGALQTAMKNPIDAGSMKRAMKPSCAVRNNRLNLEFPDAGAWHVTAMNSAGRQVFEKSFNNVRSYAVPKSLLSSGMYVVQIYSRHGTFVRKLMIP
jgi:beta-galactosidase